MSERLDMSEFEAQFESEPEDDWTRYTKFSDKMPNDDFERLAYLNDRIEDLAQGMDWRKELNQELELSQYEINDLLVRVRYIIDALRTMEKNLLNRRRPFTEGIAQNDQQIRLDRRTKEELERERARLLQEIAARERFLAQRDAIFRAIENKPWRVGVELNGTVKKALAHQLDGAHRLASAKRAILGDKPGLGKTLQAIMTIDMLRAQGEGQKVLIFTPKPVLKDFEIAFKQWTDPTTVFVLNQTLKGVKSEILDMVAHFPEIILITNYEVWRKDKTILEKLKACGFDTIILDEAHVLKDSKSKTYQDVRGLVYADNKCPKCGSANIVTRMYKMMCGACEHEGTKTNEFCSVKNVYPMTGTPILNKPAELFPLLNLIDRNGFPKENYFLNDYCTREWDYARDQPVWTFGSGGSERLMKKLGMKFTARTRESAGVVMPPQEVKHHWLELDPEKYPRQTHFVKELRERARLAFAPDAQLTTNEVLAWYTRMRQAASWPDGIRIKGCPHDPQCLFEEDDGTMSIRCHDPIVIFPPAGTPPIGESVIMDAAEEITFEAVEDGDRIVVFSHFLPVIAELEARCRRQGLRVATITGKVPQHVRQEYIDDFNTNRTKVGEHQYDVLICQYKTASVGLNLNGAQQLLMIEREWNPGKEEQAMDRIRRLDSEYDSIVHVLHCAGTVTELIDAIQDQKKNMLEGFQADVDLAEAMRKFLEG
jgi:SNF2 family DNA or RNA helicase